MPENFDNRESSTSLTVTGKAGGNGSSFRHASAPALRPTAAETQTRLKKEADARALTQFFSKSCDLPADWPKTGPVPPRILSLAPAAAPPGHPEHGRWHVIVARRTAR